MSKQRFWLAGAIGLSFIVASSGIAAEEPIVPPSPDYSAGGCDPETTVKRIVWQPNVFEAFVQALEDQRPLVVLFASAPSYRPESGKNHSNELMKQLEDPAAQALADEAVYTICHYDHASGKLSDEFGRRMWVHLKLDALPTMCILAPRTDRLTEVSRMQGSFPAAKIVEHLKVNLPKALSPEALAPDNPSAAPIPAPAPAAAASLPAPATPAEAIGQLSQAVRAGDSLAVANLLTAPYVPLYTEVTVAAGRLGAAKRRLLAAMDVQFGAAEDAIPYGDDDTELREDLQKMSMTLLPEGTYPELKLFIARVRIDLKSGKSKTVELRVVREEDGWKIQPDETLGFIDEGRCRRYADFLNQLAADYGTLAQQVSAGAFASRQACKEAARERYLARRRPFDEAR